MSKNEDGSTELVWVIFRIKSFTTHLNFVSQLFRNVHHDLQRHIENVRGGRRRRKKRKHEKGEIMLVIIILMEEGKLKKQ